MKVAHYSTSLSRSAGGLFYSVSGLAKAQADAGLDVLAVGGADQYFQQHRPQWASVPLRPHSLTSGGYGLSAQAVKEIRGWDPDITHVHGIWTAASIYARIFTALGMPVVISPRGMLDPWILARRQMVKRIHAALYARPAFGKAHTHALNHSEYESVINYLPNAVERTFIIPSGIGESIAGGGPHRSGVLYIGRLHAKKQVIQLARLWSVSSDLQGTLLTIAGWGDNSYEKELTQVTDGALNVRFVGPLYGEAKASALGAARFFILPSLSEGLPVAALEALQHGTIPILTDQCNLPELFQERVALRISSDLSDVNHVLSRAIVRPFDYLEAMSKAGEEYSRRYLWSTIALQMYARYKSILG